MEEGKNEDMVPESLPMSNALPAKAGRREIKRKTAKSSTEEKIEANPKKVNLMSGPSKTQLRGICTIQGSRLVRVVEVVTPPTLLRESRMGVVEAKQPPTHPPSQWSLQTPECLLPQH